MSCRAGKPACSSNDGISSFEGHPSGDWYGAEDRLKHNGVSVCRNQRERRRRIAGDQVYMFVGAECRGIAQVLYLAFTLHRDIDHGESTGTLEDRIQ